MARIRYIKPQAAEDVRLAECSRDARLLYRDLWCHMDRQGLTEDEPKLIKKNVFPYDDDLTVSKTVKLIDELVRIGRLIRLEWNGHKLLWCPTFEVHQKFHRDEEPKYRIPQKELETRCQHPVERVPEGFNASAKSALNGELVTGNGNGEPQPAAGPPALLKIWNQNRGNLPEARGCSKTRRKHAEARWEEKPEAEYWTTIVLRLAGSPFCLGKNDRGWKADFDFLIQPDTQHKALEGKYDDRGKNGHAAPPDAEELAERRELARLRAHAMGNAP